MTLPWHKRASKMFVNLNTFCLMKCLEVLHLDLCEDFLFQIIYLTVYRLGEKSLFITITITNIIYSKKKLLTYFLQFILFVSYCTFPCKTRI